ncbi:NfeD family protein [Sagittula sp. SSi028]|uniref:NfeD family protein n=1 Tax=Sagittula sp. SSi028 TaxID=3400636 RepID=UPI003AF84076
MLWQAWWLWLAFGVVLLLVEIAAPGFVALGLAVGAFVVGLLLLVVGVESLVWLLLIWAVASLIAWVVIRKLAGERKGQVKIWDTDINE